MAGTPLTKKLGIKPGMPLVVFDAPPAFEQTLGPLPDGATIEDEGEVLDGTRSVVFALLFVTEEKALRALFQAVLRHLQADGAIWMAWPKKASKKPTNLSFNVVQRIGLEAGLVDNKICAIDRTWSGIRFVVRKADRAGWPP